MSQAALLQSLYERVYASPDDDQARLVLADALTEAGDPRGEFIVIQVTAPGGRARGMARLKELQLRREQGPGWLPPGVRASTARFRRGFPYEVVLTGPTDPAHPGWRTVERLHVAEVELPSRRSPLGGQVRPALKAVLGCGPGLVQELIAVPPPRLEALSFFCSHEQLWKTVGPGLARLGGLKVVEIAIPTPPGIAPDAGGAAIGKLVSQHAARLERLRVPSVSARPTEVQAFLRAHAPRAVVELVYLERPGGEAWLEVDVARVSMHYREPVPPVVLEAMRTRVRQCGLDEVEVVDEGERTRRGG